MQAKQQAKGEVPQHKTGRPFGLWGAKVDSIPYWTERRATLMREIDQMQRNHVRSAVGRLAWLFVR
jgi:hypothetical protein